MRKLATIQQINNIEPIDGADSIETATCLGWHVVVKKGEFKVGDKCVYIEIDSIVPKENPVFSFLESRKYKVKTIKLRGQVSQGLCLPVSMFPELNKCKIGDDVTEILGIKKHDPEAEAEKKISESKKQSAIHKALMRFKVYREIYYSFKTKEKGFPSDVISKSDEERIQSMPDLLDKIRGATVSYTEKVDGQSYTATLKRHKFLALFNYYTFTIASRNLKINPNQQCSYTDVTKRLHIEDKLKSELKKQGCDRIAIQGEIIGSKIQGNKYHVNENKLYLFKVVYWKKGLSMTLSQAGVQTFAHDLGLQSVPFLGTFKITDETTVDSLVNLSGKDKSKVFDTEREGIVIREDLPNYSFSFKVINPKFLLKNDE